MPQYGSIESLLAYAPPARSAYVADHQSAPRRQAPAFVSLMQEKVRSLSSILADIEQEARHRQSVSADVIHRIYEHYTYLKAKLFELYIFPITSNRALESRRSALEKQLDALKQEDRRERVLCWQDVAKLRREFRTWLK